jgi:hypothetical protein
MVVILFYIGVVEVFFSSSLILISGALMIA